MIDWLLGRNARARPRIGRFHSALRSGDAARSERVLLALERKRVLDAVWLLTLGLELAALGLAAALGGAERGLGVLSRSLLAFGALFVVATDLCYRLRSPRAIDAAVYVTQLAGLLALCWLWRLAGGADEPAGLALFALPLFASGLLALPGLPLASTAVALAGIASAASGRLAEMALPGLVIAGVGLGSPALARLLMRLYQRLRSHSDLSDEARGMFESLIGGASDPTVVVYADTCQVVYASDSFLRRTMLEPKEVAGRSLYNVLHFEERGRLETLLEQRSGEVPFQKLQIGRESFVANLRFFHTQHEGTRYISLAFQEVTDLYWFRSAFDAMDDALVIVGEAGDLLYANRSAHEMFGELYVGKPMLEVLRVNRLLTRAGLAEARSLERVEIQGFPYHLTVSAPRLGQGGQTCHVFWLNGFAEPEARADRATRDPLTGIHNRRWFERQVQRAVREATPAAGFALALLDLDGFKTINEELGEAAGDAALAAVARAIGDELRPVDGLCRLDGDAFALLLPGVDLRAAELAVQEILTRLAQLPLAGGDDARCVSASAGVTVCLPGESAAALVARADEALHEAKEGGGGWYGLRDPAVSG